MIIQFAPFMLLAGVIYGAARLLYLHISGKKGMGAGAELLRLCFICYIFALVALVWVPEDFWDLVWSFIESGEMPQTGFRFFSGNYTSRNLILQCLKGDFAGVWREKYPIAANVLMFVPLGFLLPLVFEKVKPLGAVFVCLGATCLIEIVQPVVGRTGDLDDVIANFLGGVLGAVMAAVVSRVLKRRR